jgi:hypothetical protein
LLICSSCWHIICFCSSIICSAVIIVFYSLSFLNSSTVLQFVCYFGVFYIFLGGL